MHHFPTQVETRKERMDKSRSKAFCESQRCNAHAGLMTFSLNMALSVSSNDMKRVLKQCFCKFQACDLVSSGRSCPQCCKWWQGIGALATFKRIFHKPSTLHRSPNACAGPPAPLQLKISSVNIAISLHSKCDDMPEVVQHSA